MSQIKRIGIIAEDESDFESSKILIRRLTKKKNLDFRKSLANGCGRLKRKAPTFAVDLKNRGCDLLILMHDLDKNNLEKLRTELGKLLRGNPFPKYFVCIPIEEIEAWFLSDPATIKKVFKLKRTPKVGDEPESIDSPKEKLGEYVYSCSGNEKKYINTHHNAQLASQVSLDLIRKKCGAFNELCNFILTQKY
ncbi:MAG: Uncharacterized protein LiPW15_141 [Parcubacteria group bacterium LiPW_15]|nr:MAG: Uncharacterized protein LiPW15_141 [Parcubacteria group bacterium LiPW_15]